MTVPAKITQAEQERILKVLKAAGYELHSVILDFKNLTMEVIIGVPGETPALKASSLDRYLTKT